MALRGVYRKAFFFTFDSLLAAVILLGTLMIITKYYMSEQEMMHIGYVSQDIITALNTLEVGETNNSWVETKIGDGNITNLNLKITEQIGQFWAEGKSDLATQLCDEMIQGLIDQNKGFVILINNEEICGINKTEQNTIISSRKMVSGIEKFKPVEGLISQAYLTNILNKKYSSYVYFGGFVGQGNITTHIEDIPQDAILQEAYIELDAGERFNLFINKERCNSTFYPNGGNMTADEWNISSCISSLVTGARNNFTISFMDDISSSYIGGGFIKVIYLTGQMQQNTTAGNKVKWLPEIIGVVNLYSSFYVPGNLNNMKINLHYFADLANVTNNTLYMTIGDETVLRTKNPGGEETVVLTDTNLTPYLNYAGLGLKTVPIRIGFENVSFGYIYVGNADVALVTDVSGSMGWRMDSDSSGTRRNCGDSNFNNSDTTRLSVAKCLDKEFAIDVINITGNNVGLISYESSTVSSQTLYPTGNITPINNTIGTSVPETGYMAGGGTCICCGVNSAVDMLMENVTMTFLISSCSTEWNYTTDYLLGNPARDSNNNTWFNFSYEYENNWSTGGAVIGATNGYMYVPLVVTEIGSILTGNRSYADLWEHGDDLGGAPNDFSSGILNYTANTFGITGADDGWDWDLEDNSGPFGYDDNIDYNEIVGGMIEFDNQVGGSNSCSGYDCSGAYGIKVNITSELYNTILNGGKAKISFNYEWDGNDNPFEPSDEVWIKAYWESSTTGIHYLGSEQSSAGGDTTLEIDRTNNPDTEFSGTYTQDITQWIEGEGMYYLAVGGKLYANSGNEWGYFKFDNIQIEFEEPDPDVVYADLWEHGDDLGGAPNDFSSGILNYTANTFGITGADDGWDWDLEDNSGPFGYDDNIDYNEIVGGMIEFDNQVGGSNSCSGYDCSGAYGIKVNITQGMYDIIQTESGSVILSLWYEWAETSGNAFESSDQVWVKATWTSPISGEHYLGNNLDSGHYGGDSDPEIGTADNPDTDFSGTYAQDLKDWIEGPGMYYLEIGGKVYASYYNEYGTWRFDNIQLAITNKTNHYYFRKYFTVNNLSKVQRGVMDILSDDRVLVYLNGELIDEDLETHNAEYWNRRGVNIPGSMFRSGENVIAVELINNNLAAKFDLELIGLDDPRDKAMAVMTDGVANGQCARQGTGDARQDAIKAACEARQDYGIVVYAVGYGDGADEATLESIAECGGGIYTKSDNITTLKQFYEDVASSIVAASRHSQTIEIQGEMTDSVLYGDSYIELNYTPIIDPPGFGEISVLVEENDFKNCSFNVSIPNGLRIVDSKLTSYSSEHWTDGLVVNDNIIYNLSYYDEDYTELGDPFIVNIPPTVLSSGINTFFIRTGDSPDNFTGCSLNNTFIYTAMIPSSVSYNTVLPIAEGCKWSIEFDDGSTEEVNIPPTYNGSKSCSFTSTNQSYNLDDAIDAAAFQLLNQLDFNNDNRSDINFDELSLYIQSFLVPGVPSMWGPAIVEARIW